MSFRYNPFTGNFDTIRSNFNISASNIIDVIGDHDLQKNQSFLKVSVTATINLFDAVGSGGNIVIIKNIGNGAVTLNPFGVQLIDDDLVKVIVTQWTSISLISDNLNWFIL